MSTPGRPVRYAATAVGAAYAVALYVAGFRFDDGIRQILAYLPAAAAIAVVAFDRWTWKWPGVHRLVGRPRIDGTWLTTLTPHPDSHIPEGGNRGPIDTAVIIEQTYWSVTVRLLTAESRSISTSASIYNRSAQQAVLAYTYANEPEQRHRPRSQPHAGATELVITGRQPQQMSGTYWTERLTVGDMTMHLLDRRADYPTLAAVTGEAGAETSGSRRNNPGDARHDQRAGDGS
ncbi:Cap15 family cyclic dinucleotide receptor domain-containing protein [Klenkia brasiliensis]|uniref:CD-NTase-associated protein 15 domain-containing protein n=1 Tax=Klenkia brasiliensis TaxID=333142 RepID=A0A1G7SF65_9ACTN|nr:hypothetical protein [Klenkia brasiliensis]SDG21643.1 hypothetical protein SAMN05660324_2000 [Klenkia brasiliensis]